MIPIRTPVQPWLTAKMAPEGYYRFLLQSLTQNNHRSYSSLNQRLEFITNPTITVSRNQISRHNPHICQGACNC